VSPEQLLYAKTHEWAHIQTDAKGAKVATVGISKFAVEALTDLTYMELPAVGREVQSGESFGEIESVKAVSDLYSPVDGEIIEVNEDLPDHLERLSNDPYGAGWIAKILVTKEASLKNLMEFPAYQKQCAEEH
jgi:glycine cleavage system H protein